MKLNVNSFKLRKYRKITNEVLRLDSKYREFSDNQLKDRTKYFRKQLESGHSLEEMLPDAYAVVREADFRVLGMRPFDNQVLGAVVLHFGNVAEMKTGEGKTLTATMPMYLNGLTGPGNFLITANSYLATRDAEDIGQVYEWLGLTSTAGVSVTDEELDKAFVYQHDIVYTTNSEIGFDYLIDNLADDKSKKNLQGFNYALVDEVDSVLLDLAQTPLVISGAPRVQSNLFESSNRVVKNLTEDVDYELSDDTKNVWFTRKGIENLEKYLGIKGLLSKKWSDLYRHLVLALRANTLMKKNQDYVVDNGEVMLLDDDNGRELDGMKLEAGSHQAIEAKEEVKVTDETRSMASITLQNFFKMFKKISGMTGTAKTAAREFMEVYNLPVLEIPTHKPNVRIDHHDVVYANMEEKLDATIAKIKEVHKIGRPILIETGSVSLSSLYSMALLKNGIAHNVLNARSEAREASIIAEAGQEGAVTVATSMAGRGTDIKLGSGIADKGGLLVIGTERMDNQRIDNQLRGRSGRQGDPGESVFLVSLDDKVVIENGPEWVERYRQKLARKKQQGKRVVGSPLKRRSARRIVDRSQRSSDNSMTDSRKKSVRMDDILRVQRGLIYNFRDQVMEGEQLEQRTQRIISNILDEFVKQRHLTLPKVIDFINNNIDYNFFYDDRRPISLNNRKQLRSYLQEQVNKGWQKQQVTLDNEFKQGYLQRLSILKALDVAWIEQVDNLQQLKTVVGNRSTGQHNPVFEYEKEAKKSFEKMKRLFWKGVLQNMMLSDLNVKKGLSVN
ncbi:accessory Sec system translocase SecA2, partial [Pediococcus stilesii]|uniref:accessory Sec system translocase SecA2 n=1 Tax=Pediococcus stilesii TaxID=331679 RepID=UPI000709C1A7